MRSVAFVGLLGLVACHKSGDDSDTDGQIAAPEYACPGGEGCEGSDGALQAGASVASIVPQCFETWTDVDGDSLYDASIDTFADCGCDRLCPTDEGYTAADDGEGDGKFEAVWLAGFDNGRAAVGVRGADQGLVGEGDGLWARTVVLTQGDTSLAIVAVDLVGWFHDDVNAVRELVRQQGVDVDFVIVASTHSHQSTDTMGMWGGRPFKTGYSPEYRDFLRATIAQTIADAAAARVPVTMSIGSVAPSSYDAQKGMANVGGDTRDPYVVYDDVGTAQFTDADGKTVATLVNWACHPETRASENDWISSDFVHAIRKTVEDGSHWESRQKPGVGGVAIYLNGAVGGMMTALHIDVTDPDGHTWTEGSFEKADAQGILVGEMALDAIAAGTPATSPKLSFQQRLLHLPVDNLGFQTLFLAGVFDRALFDWDDTQPITDANLPYVETEVDRVDLGPLQFLTIPGETLPELFVGGYDGSETHSPGVDLIDPNNPNPPDLSLAPPPPYWRDKMTGDTRWLVGLGNDELGYIIPPYDFKLADDSPWFSEADGDHYEETNSLGPRTQPMIDGKIDELVSWSR